ncbi:formylglycine-generating enzyme family protein [Thiothrix fructosivorans]|uniref:Formylglycine-generating enzyme family protein n=1 Tax=Thiothrix fructosivorans TaxID=111770 RepID=A0A8B0SFE3_9GAMM|nr:formylglycine-generating enzyme family protein [Thiothrix fructosivorans]QTX09891.1 formylglycine-generating enzyme family protein [Thiothrix fructosivorans]
MINKLSKASQQSQPTTVTPTMVKINGGKFTMGCDSEREDGCLANEKPAHEVNVLTFWMSKTEVTVRQYMVCVNTGACPKPQWQEKNAPSYYKAMGEALIGDNYPIVGVSQPNAIAYVQWLSQQTTKKYRLPTEAEWEYAARAGTNTAYSWGNGIGKNNANCSGDLCGDKFNYTSPVGSFAENPFGLYDMHGNVNEWMEDCWKDNYNDAPVDGNARQGCRMNASGVLRGGAWFYEPQWLRSASRNGYPLDFRINFVGFRIASTN